MELGQRIRQLRIKNDLTQEELASRCELTKGFLSQLENDIATPSLPTLMDIVEALGTTMSDFFREESEQQIVFSEEDFFIDEKEEYTINWVVPNAQKNSMEPIIICIQPHGTSQTISPHDGEEFGLVLEGGIILVNGSQKMPVSKGSTFYLSGENEHYLLNDSGKPAKVLWVCNPPIF